MALLCFARVYMSVKNHFNFSEIKNKQNTKLWPADAGKT